MQGDTTSSCLGSLKVDSSCDEKLSSTLRTDTCGFSRMSIAAPAVKLFKSHSPRGSGRGKNHQNEQDQEEQNQKQEKDQPALDERQVLSKMIRADEWHCDLLVGGDPRGTTCDLDADSEVLDPELLTCGSTNDCNVEHANAYRTQFDIGSLPCCRTSPFCSAPACSTKSLTGVTNCAKRTAKENLAYMKQADAWPAYHGWGGSFELDTSKYLDLLACRPDSEIPCPGKTFDLVFDLGANTGYYTEKFTVRNFAKNYIMVEANPGTADLLRDRWNNEGWKKRWFSEQTHVKKNDQPGFEILSLALSNHSKGKINMCMTEASMHEEGSCNVPISSLDDVISHKLTSSFQDHVIHAQSAFIKIDTEGMDELVLRGMQKLLNEQRGTYKDGSERYLVNFLQFEFSPDLMKIAKKREKFSVYDIKSVTKFMESMGFESFIIGPRFLPLSHGSWDDEFMAFTDDTNNNAGRKKNYPDFDASICPWCRDAKSTTFTSDVFAMRASHPRAQELKVALGACQESNDFHVNDPQYLFQTSQEPQEPPQATRAHAE